MKVRQLKKYKMRNAYGGEASSFYKKLKLSISMNHQTEII